MLTFIFIVLTLIILWLIYLFNNTIYGDGTDDPSVLGLFLVLLIFITVYIVFLFKCLIPHLS